MGLYDILEDMSAKRLLKTETGDNRIPGVTTATVVNNYDKDMPGRVCVSVPVRDQEANELKWARVAMPSGGREWGHYFLPETGDQVLLAFDYGNIESPYVIGCIPKDKDKFLKKSAEEQNRYKKIMTRNGSCLVFEDNQEEEGKKDRILLMTAGETHKLTLDNEKNEMILSDKEDKNRVTVNTKNGAIEIKAEKKLSIVIGDNNVQLVMQESGSMKIKCKKLQIDCDDAVSLQSAGRMKLEGSNVALAGTSTMKIEGSGITSITGKPVKLG